jgi:hypothetical protein
MRQHSGAVGAAVPSGSLITLHRGEQDRQFRPHLAVAVLAKLAVMAIRWATVPPAFRHGRPAERDQ